MGKRFDSGALELLNRSLGLAGGVGGSQFTELEDGSVTQVIEISPIARRSRVFGLEGKFVGSFIMEHGAGTTNLLVTIDPFNMQMNAVTGPYPHVMPDGFDLWIIGASGMLVTGISTNLDDVGLSITSDQEASFGFNQGGGPDLGSIGIPEINLALWDEFHATGIVAPLFNSHSGKTWMAIGQRLRRGELIRLRSGASNAIAYMVHIVLGLFPTALGQDVVT